jgi:hypothetical protein
LVTATTGDVFLAVVTVAVLLGAGAAFFSTTFFSTFFSTLAVFASARAAILASKELRSVIINLPANLVDERAEVGMKPTTTMPNKANATTSWKNKAAILLKLEDKFAAGTHY